MHQSNALCALFRTNAVADGVGPSDNVTGAVDSCFMLKSASQTAETKVRVASVDARCRVIVASMSLQHGNFFYELTWQL